MHPVVFPHGGWKTIPYEDGPQPAQGSEEARLLEEIIQSDALTDLTPSHKELLRKYRYEIIIINKIVVDSYFGVCTFTVVHVESVKSDLGFPLRRRGLLYQLKTKTT